jgi:hypothetical protein
MTQDPQSDVAAFLADELSRTVGTDLFTGAVLAVGEGVPTDAIFVEAQPGEAPDPVLGASQSEWEAEVEVTVRGAPGDPEGPRVLARSVRDALHLANARGGLTSYTLVTCDDSEPEYLEADQQQCHEYAVSFTLRWVA